MEVQEKRKRGRPGFGNEEGISILSKMWFEIKTKRGIQNKIYELRAWNLLEEIRKKGVNVNFLVDNKKQTMEQTLLMEIGRIGDEELMEYVIVQLCKEAGELPKRTVRDWQKDIRFLRLKWKKEGII